MSQQLPAFSCNTLLRALSNDDLGLLKPHFERVRPERRLVLVPPDQRIDYVYFLEDGVASIVAKMPDARRTEVSIFGRDGVSATCLLLGADRTPHETFIQVPGQCALRIRADKYLAAIGRSETLRTMLLRFVQVSLIQVAQSTGTNAHMRMEARLARWLLMCHDRVEGDEIHLTHDFMGMMIGAERSGVTVTLHILEGAGVIWSKRGRVIIRNRHLLEGLAGKCYGVPEAEYRRLIGPLGRQPAVNSER